MTHRATIVKSVLEIGLTDEAALLVGMRKIVSRIAAELLAAAIVVGASLTTSRSLPSVAPSLISFDLSITMIALLAVLMKSRRTTIGC